MSKTTRNKYTSLQKTRVTTFLSMLLLLCVSVSFGQLKVNHNTLVTANTVLSSKEEANVFDSSVLGDDEFVLNGESQFLETVANTSLPTLRVANADELVIRTELKLRGNLVVQSGTLVLQKAIHIQGELLLEKDAKIVNEHFVMYKNKHLFDKDIMGSSIVEMANASSLWMGNFESYTLNLPEVEKRDIIISNDFIKNQNNIVPFAPPPKNRLLA